MPLPDEKFIEVDGIRTRYFVKGEGETIVLFHGGYFGSPAYASSADDWDLNFDELSTSSRVYAIDRLGQGYTDNPKSKDGYTMQAVVRHAHNALRALGIDGAHLVGHGFGGYVACRLTVEHPGIVKSCTIVDGDSCAPGTDRIDLVLANMPGPALSRESQRWAIEQLASDHRCITKEWLDCLVRVAETPKYREAVQNMVGEGLYWTRFSSGFLTQKEETHHILNLRGTERPVMLIWGYEDPTVSSSQVFDLYAMLARNERYARWHIFNRAGHFSFREHPARFNDVLERFIVAA